VTLDILKELSSQLIDIIPSLKLPIFLHQNISLKLLTDFLKIKRSLKNISRISGFQNLKTLLKKLKTQLSEANKESDYKILTQ
jgi:DNA repair protein RecN (Recombination protein N)